MKNTKHITFNSSSGPARISDAGYEFMLSVQGEEKVMTKVSAIVMVIVSACASIGPT